MNGVLYVFYFFASITLLAAVNILITKNVVHAVLSLLGVFIGISAMYVFAGADFLAISQLVVYIGGILVLMLFGVMLTTKESGTNYPVSKNNASILGFLSGLSILVALVYLVVKNKETLFPGNEKIKLTEQNTINSIGIALIRDYSIAFEFIGVLLLIALIGAAVIAGNTQKNKPTN